MEFGVKNGLFVRAVAVPHEFIDTYMVEANGEYVKVFLYLLRHENELERLENSDIADALKITEADVRRALTYWEKLGVLTSARETASPAENPNVAAARETALSAENPGAVTAEGVPALPPAGDGGARMERLSGDEEFTALLYVVQQYLQKNFTQIECEKFAYFYDCLGMSSELLEYLAEYCADSGHTGIRYLEKVALNWYQQGIRTGEEAKDYTLRYSRDISSVMKAFGITGRNPATSEQEYIKKWFKQFGFDRKIVVEACNRTIKATGAASFPYADKILSGWKENGVKVLADVGEVDKKRQKQAEQSREKKTAPKKPAAVSRNRFHNFEGRSYDYDEMVWRDIRERYGKGEMKNGA